MLSRSIGRIKTNNLDTQGLDRKGMFSIQHFCRTFWNLLEYSLRTFVGFVKLLVPVFSVCFLVDFHDRKVKCFKASD